MAALQEYKCPCCSGAVEFSSELQKMKCGFCDTEFEMEALLAYDKDLKSEGTDNMVWTNKENKDWFPGETDGLREYVCKSCGGVIVGEETTAASTCPYCDNPIVMMGQFTGSLKPDYVIPFKLNKEAAKAGLNKHISGKKLLPKIFKDQNHIDEIKGIYVPFWLFDSDANARVRYKGKKVSTWSDDNYNYVQENFYSIFRAGKIGFEHVPVDGSTKMADDLMESIEPYDFSQAVDFQTAYLAGFLADKYDVSAEDSYERANNRIRTTTHDAFARTVEGYTSVTPEGGSIELLNGKRNYVLYPVWILNTTWNGQKYTFAMNGQTGKFVGDLPVDKSALKKMRFKIWSIATVAVFAILSLLWLI